MRPPLTVIALCIAACTMPDGVDCAWCCKGNLTCRQIGMQACTSPPTMCEGPCTKGPCTK